MTLYIIGIGLGDEKDISVKGLEAIKECETVYLEDYTCKLSSGKTKQDLENYYGKTITPANRSTVEQEAELTILKSAQTVNTAFLVIGDALSATTHIDLMQRAQEKGIKVEVIHNASVLNAVSLTGLQLYKFGKTTSIPFPKDNPDVKTPYEILAENQSIGAHTLFLLDLNPEKNKYLTIKQAIEYLLNLEEKEKSRIFTKKTFCIACSNLAGKNIIKAGTAQDVGSQKFEDPPFCLIVPGKMHFMEEEFLKQYLI